MPFWLRFLGGEAKERLEEMAAKRRLEEKLGRKVGDHELYSLNAHLEAAEDESVPAASPASSAPARTPSPPMGKTARRILTVIVAAIVLTSLCLVVSVGAWLFLPGRTFNRLNPFMPNPPQAAFPASIAGYNLEDVNYDPTYSSICKCNFFRAYYKKSADDTMGYTLYVFKSPDEARKYMNKKDYVGGINKIYAQTETRLFMMNKGQSHAVVALTVNQHLILMEQSTHKGFKPELLVEFENSLPYAFYGVSPPAPRSLDEYKEAVADVQNKSKAVNTNSSSNTAADELKDVREPECRAYLATLKKLSSCNSLAADQRKKFSDNYNETLKTARQPVANDAAKQARALVCKQTNDAMQKLLATCNK